ncbi:MAG: class I tRNA ligase family protein, partial [Mollicutes bacterium]|nr:class I tRNA ligase family protein [Mollicutes bacterium]
YLSKQWFVKMRPLADRVLENQKNKDTKVNFVPARYEKVMNHWMEITYDWCISRQLWWGHRIPAWYKGEEVKVQKECPGEGWIQDEDVLDTWFSSALWPFSTLGWPNKTEDLERYFPTDVLVTAYDIIFFWVARMAFSSLKQMNSRPFKDCIIHGLIRDKQGRKMSKSLGNGIDPMDMIDEYGCDALRFYLTTTSAMGMDIRFDTDKVASTWNFINKLWNASRFVLMKLEGFNKEDYTLKNLNNEDKWILTKLNETIKKVTKSMDKYEFNNAGSELYSFIWDDFCDKYIEMSKFSESNETKSTLLYTITAIVKMMHPFMPFVTEEIYSNFEIKDNDILLMTEYPIYDKKLIFKSETKEIDEMLEYVTLFRNKKTESKISNEFEVIDYNNNELLNKMLKLNDKLVSKSKYNDKLTIELYNYKFDLFFDNSKNSLEEELKRKEEIEKLESSIARRKKLLSNENYVNKAPEAIVNKEREDLEKEEKRLEILKKN